MGQGPLTLAVHRPFLMVERMVRRSFSFRHFRVCVLLLGAIALGGLHAVEATVFHDGPPESAPFFTAPDNVRLTSEYAEVSRSAPLGEEQTDHYLLPVPPGEFSAGFEALTVRNLRTGEEVDALGNEEAFTSAQVRRFEEKMTADDLGILRRVQVVAVRVDRERPVTVDGESWEIASYTARLEHAGVNPETAPASDDSGFTEGLYREFLDRVLTVSAGVDAFAIDSPGGDMELPWRPEPELSPGLPWSRIPVREDGLYAIDARWLREAGIEPAELRPEDLYMVREGRQIPLHPLGEEDATFARGARAVFYATGNPGRETAYRSHFLGRRPDGVEAMAFGEIAPPPGNGVPESNRVYTRRLEVREENELKTRMGAFLSVQEMVWVWTELGFGERSAIAFSLPGLAPGAERNVTLRFVLYSQSGEYPDSLVLFAEGEGMLDQAAEVDPEAGEAVITWPSRLFRPGENTMELWPEADEPEGSFHLERVIAEYPARIAPEEGRHVYTPVAAESGDWGAVNLTGFRTGSVLGADVRHADRPELLPRAGDGLAARTYYIPFPEEEGVVFAQDDALPAPPLPENRPFGDWQRRDLSADVLIVTHRRFEEAARMLAADHEEEGRQALVVDVEQLYDNFSHGDLSTDAIHAFLRQSVYTWEGRRPFAAILVGDSNADGRDTAREGIPNYMPIPVVAATGEGMGEQFSSDSVYSWLSPDGDELADLVIARLSPATEEEALNTVANIADYRRTQDEEVPWGNRLVSVVDTGGFRDALEEVHFNSIGPAVRNDFIMADDFAWEDNYYLPQELIQRPEDTKVGPLVTQAIEDAFHDGTALMTFFGHGAPNLWSNHRFWFGGGTPNSDILRLENEGRLPYVTTFTCNNAVVDYPLPPWNISIAEDFMRHRGKGAIACFMPSGPGYTSSHKVLAEGFLRAWSELGVREHALLGEFSRINHQVRREFDDHTRMFIFLGDPALRLPPLPGRGGEHSPPGPLQERLVEEGGDLLITAVNEVDAGPEGRRWSIRLRNETREPRTATVRTDILTPEGATVERLEREVEVPPLAGALAFEEFSLPEPGVYTVRFSLPHERGEYFRSRLPSREALRHVVEEPAGENPVLLRHTKSFAPESEENYRFRVDVYHPGEHSFDAELTVTPVEGGEPLFTSTPRISAGRVQQVGGLVPKAAVEDGTSVMVQLFVQADDEEEMRLAAEGEWLFGREALASLIIPEESIRVYPETLSDGLTVFVEGVIRNESAVRTGPVFLSLFHGDDEALEEPLPDLTSVRDYRFTALLPGEQRPFRLRWDPMDNAGEYAIRVVADPEERLALRSRTAAGALIPLSVRTKARLVTGDVLIGEGDTENSMRLVAEVGNTGETDARQVVVNFYYAQDQREDTKVGEVLVRRVPAGSTELVEFVWEPDREEIARLVEPVQPSFTIALRGSLQRVSSVIEQ